MYDEDNKIITATINRIQISIDVAVIRRVLQFKDTEDYPSEFDRSLVRGLFTRLRYNGNIMRSMMNNNDVCAPYKYLLHVLLHCMSGQRAGFDECRLCIQSPFGSHVDAADSVAFLSDGWMACCAVMDVLVEWVLEAG